jgi:hypothetical protein
MSVKPDIFVFDDMEPASTMPYCIRFSRMIVPAVVHNVAAVRLMMDVVQTQGKGVIEE